MMSDATWAVSKENLTASLSIVLCFFLMVQLQPNEPLELPSGMGKGYNREHPQYCAYRGSEAHGLSTPQTLRFFKMSFYRLMGSVLV